MTAQSHRAVRATVLASSTLASLLLAELGLRAIGRGPCRPYPALAHVPVMTAPDPELGWVPREGRFTWSPTGRAEDAVTLTLGPDGRTADTTGDRRIDLYGGSFVLGFAVDDGLELGARLADLLPDTRVRDLGVPGYGAVQSRGLSLRHLASEPAPDTLVYGFVDFHEARDVGAASWLHALDLAGEHHPWHGLPTAALDGDGVRFLPPRTWHHWGPAESSALAALGERAVIALRDRWTADKGEITLRVVLRWREEALAAGVRRFVVAVLYAPDRHDGVLARLRAEGVEVADLHDGGYPASAVPVDGHPSPEVHAAWAQKLAEALR
ncbi:MAG: hypothetical protein H6738_03435 [Alphaproteobacteria bacterium]|nr:hypothetical protein [Alphaproteobacteria bacterium]